MSAFPSQSGAAAKCQSEEFHPLAFKFKRVLVFPTLTRLQVAISDPLFKNWIFRTTNQLSIIVFVVFESFEVETGTCLARLPTVNIVNGPVRRSVARISKIHHAVVHRPKTPPTSPHKNPRPLSTRGGQFTKLPNECFDKQNPAAFEAEGERKMGVVGCHFHSDQIVS